MRWLETAAIKHDYIKGKEKKKLERLFRFKLTALDTKKNLDASFLFFFPFLVL